MKTIYIIILGLVIFLQSCGLPYCIKNPFEKEDMLWLNPYEKGDIVIFQSTQGRLDSILITAKDIFNPTNTFIFDLRGCNCWEGDNEFNAIAGFDFKFIDVDLMQKNPNVQDGLLSIEKVNKNKPILATFEFCELYSRENTTYKDTSIVFSKKRIADCKVFHRKDCDIGKSKSKLIVENFVWSKQFGLVQYVIETGERFDYLKKSPVALDMKP